MPLSGLAEMLSLASVIPLLAVLTNSERLLDLQITKFIFSWTGLDLVSSKNFILSSTLIFIFAAFIAAFVRIFNLWLGCRLAALIGSDLSCKIYEKSLNQKYEHHLNNNSASVITSSTSHIGSTVVALNLIVQISTALIISCFLLSGLLLLDWQIAFLALFIFSFAYFFLGNISKNQLRRNSLLVAKATEFQVKALQEGLGAIRDVILGNYQNFYIKVYKKSDLQLRKSLGQSLFISSFPRYVLESLGLIFIALIAFSLSIQNGSISQETLPLLGTFALAAQRLLPVFQQIYSGWANLKSLKDRVKIVLIKLEEDNYFNKQKVLIKPLPFEKKIQLKEISFSYDKKNSILKGINLEINKGERIAIIGKTGSGKSTLSDLIMGLLEPTKGEIYVDGILINDEKYPERFNEWRKNIAHVPQTIFLSDNSIAENIALGVPRDKINMKLIKESAEKAQIANFIESCPNSYENIVGERGVKLSGGQRQRIGIARAHYKKARVLVFDEATSALDDHTEAEVMKAINCLSKDLTIIIIAHRLSTISNCQKIIKIKNGKIDDLIINS